MIKITEDELDDLFVDENAVIDKKLMKDLLLPYMRISNSGVIIPEQKFLELGNKEKVSLFLLARKAMYLRGMIDDEKSGPTEISESIDIPLGSAKHTCASMKNIFDSKEGKYFIPNFNLAKLKNMFVEVKK